MAWSNARQNGSFWFRQTRFDHKIPPQLFYLSLSLPLSLSLSLSLSLTHTHSLSHTHSHTISLFLSEYLLFSHFWNMVCKSKWDTRCVFEKNPDLSRQQITKLYNIFFLWLTIISCKPSLFIVAIWDINVHKLWKKYFFLIKANSCHMPFMNVFIVMCCVFDHVVYN